MSSQSPLVGKKPSFFSLPKLPVAGFFSRLLAILMDFALLISAINLVARVPAVESWFMSMGSSSKFITGYFVFLYFFLFNGPFGKGRTIGKMVMGIRVIDYSGGVISYRQSFFRTMTLFPIFLTWPLMSSVASPESFTALYIENLFTSLLQAAMLFTTALLIPFNPYKQGLHDYFSQSIVRKNEQPIDFAELAALLGPNWKMLQRQPQFSGFVSLAIILVFLGIVTNPRNMSEDALQYRQLYLSPRKEPSLRELSVSFRYLPEAGLFGTEAEWIGEPLAVDDPRPKIIYLLSEPFSREEEDRLRLVNYIEANYLPQFLAYEEEILQKMLLRGQIESVDQGSPGSGRESAYDIVKSYFDNEVAVVILYQTQLWLSPSPMPITKDWKAKYIPHRFNLPQTSE